MDMKGIKSWNSKLSYNYRYKLQTKLYSVHFITTYFLKNLEKVSNKISQLNVLEIARYCI